MNNSPTNRDPEDQGKPEPIDKSILSILLRDTVAMRQRLFSYLQFYLTAQAGLAVLFGLVAHDSYEVVKLPKAEAVLVLSIIGLFSSFLVIAYGLVMLRPGPLSRNWISDQMKRGGDGPTWDEACRKRLEVLMDANEAFGKRIGWIRVGILIQLFCGFVVFLVSLGI